MYIVSADVLPWTALSIGLVILPVHCHPCRSPHKLSQEYLKIFMLPLFCLYLWSLLKGLCAGCIMLCLMLCLEMSGGTAHRAWTVQKIKEPGTTWNIWMRFQLQPQDISGYLRISMISPDIPRDYSRHGASPQFLNFMSSIRVQPSVQCSVQAVNPLPREGREMLYNLYKSWGSPRSPRQLQPQNLAKCASGAMAAMMMTGYVGHPLCELRREQD